MHCSMDKRSQKGSALAFVGTCTVGLAALGLGLVFLMFLLGGSRQLQNATDAGSLNVAKQLIRHPQVDLQGNVEKALFSPFSEDSGKVSLGSYNKIEGAAMLIGLNAMEIKANNPANARPVRNAARIATLVNDPTSGIGRRIADAVNENEHAANDFLGQSMSNSLRLLSIFGKQCEIDDNAVNYKTAWLGQNDAANVAFDTTRFPHLPARYLASEHGKTFVKGYAPIDLGAGLTYNFVSIAPFSQPHMVSTHRFQNETLSFANVPANSVRNSGRVNNGSGKQVFDLSSHACAVAAPTEPFVKPSLPSGYLIFFNPGPAGTMGASVPISRNIFNNQLLDQNGVFVGKDADGKPLAFSTDKNVFKDWANFNTPLAADAPAPATPPTAPAVPTSGDNQVFLSDGKPIKTAKEGPTAVMAKVKSVEKITFRDAEKPLYIQLLEAMKKAYPPAVTSLPSGGGGLIALEKYKLDIINLFIALGGGHGDGGGSIAVPPPSGLKAFDHDRAYQNQVPFSHDATPYELMQQILVPHPNYAAENARMFAMASANAVAGGWDDPWVTRAESQDGVVNLSPDDRTKGFEKVLFDRVRQIKPEATDSEIKTVLGSQTLPLNSALFLYMSDPKGARTLVLTTTPPEAIALAPGGTVKDIPDGDQLAPYCIDYVAHFRAINTSGDGGGLPLTFMSPPGMPLLIARDSMLWTPSSGANACLGLLEFQNLVAPANGPGGGGVGFWSAPN